MNRTVKTFLLWLLMAVLPLHAAAASMGMSCAPVPQQQSGHAPAAAHHAPAADAHAHHGGDHHAAAEAMGSGHDAASPEQAGYGGHASCSACSPLCTGAAAPPSAILPLPAFEGADAPLVASITFAAGFVPDGLQRPPRQARS